MPQFTVDQLVNAIRNAESLADLQRLVGPSEEESEAARKRLAQMESLTDACKWSETCPDNQAHAARERYKRIECEQRSFENQYC